jgi:hypothetical protein
MLRSLDPLRPWYVSAAENLEGNALWGRKTLHCLDSPGSLRTGIHDSASGSAPAFGLVVWTRVGGAVAECELRTCVTDQPSAAVQARRQLSVRCVGGAGLVSGGGPRLPNQSSRATRG